MHTKLDIIEVLEKIITDSVNTVLYIKSSFKFIGLAEKKIEPKIVNIFLPFSFNIFLGCSKEPSH